MKKKFKLTNEMSIPMLKQKRYSWFFNPTLILLLLTIFMWQCEKDDFEGETKGVCPEVISSDPANGATNVVTNKIITATFNEALIPATINNQTFYVELGKVTAVGIVTDANKQLKSLEESNSPTISGVVTYADKVATFTPSKPLEANKTYSGIITKKVKDPAGNYPLKDYIWSFTIGNVPTVISTNPLNAISKVPLNKIITATFTTEMNPSTINGTTFLVHQGTNQIAGTVTYAGKTATFSPTSPLTDNTVYTGTITIAATDLLGNAMASEYKWSFSTAQTQYTIFLSSNPLAGGSTSGGGLFNKDDQATLVATPLVGYAFTNWTEGAAVVSTNTSFTITTSSDRTLVANFTLLPPSSYTLNVTTVNGTVLKNPNTATYNSGATVQLTATPSTGYTFTSWSGDATGSTNPLTVTMNANKNITANFTLIPPSSYTLNVTTVNGTVLKNPNTATYNSGATVQLTATPNSGYVFDSWSGDALGSTNPLTVTMNANKNITANFTLIPPSSYTLNVTAVNGTVLKNPNTATYNSGATVQLTATPNSGYVFDSWSGDALRSTNPLTVTMNANKNITANFNAVIIPPLGPGVVNLGTAANFVAIGKTGIDAKGVTSITGDIGVSPAAATALTGFGLIMDATGTFATSSMVVGKIYASDYTTPTPAKMTTAISDMENALTAAMGMVNAPIIDLGAGNISGMTLVAGLYKYNTGLLITNEGVTLTGGLNDTWVFQIASDFTVNPNAIITLAGGAQAKNVFWVTSTQALIDTNVQFKGNIIAQTLISINTGSSVLGRLLSQSAVTLNAATIVKP